METVLIKCPHCGEQMQVPVDREFILCMFCGERINLTEAEKPVPKKESADTDSAGKPINPDICQENMRFVLEHIREVYRDYENKVRDFKKDTYHELFELHKEENYAFYISVKRTLENAAQEELEDIYHQIAGAFVKEQEEALGQISKKNARASLQMDKNMFLAIYVLPAIKEIRDSKADRLADVICKDWGNTFKDSNISASDYDSIMQGFKRKLCYVTTAVCLNLNKGENCEELRLIKEFRDGYLSSTKEGRTLIEEYYDIAPTLVKRIAKDTEAHEKYVWLWNTYLAPCVTYIKNGQPESCKETYCSMMEELREEYMTGKQRQASK